MKTKSGRNIKKPKKLKLWLRAESPCGDSGCCEVQYLLLKRKGAHVADALFTFCNDGIREGLGLVPEEGETIRVTLTLEPIER